MLLAAGFLQLAASNWRLAAGKLLMPGKCMLYDLWSKKSLSSFSHTPHAPCPVAKPAFVLRRIEYSCFDEPF